jgi:hypothetical protein
VAPKEPTHASFPRRAHGCDLADLQFRGRARRIVGIDRRGPTDRLLALTDDAPRLIGPAEP